MRYALITDIHGHIDAFSNALSILGVDLKTLTFPPDLTIINMGDLVHGGPNGLACLQLADRLLQINPDSYIQLWGNHDIHYIGGPDVSGRAVFRNLGKHAEEVFTRWLDENLAQLAYALDTADLGEVLLTHGGLTAGFWSELGGFKSAGKNAKQLNALLLSQDELEQAWRPGWLMTGEYNLSAGVTGPRTGAELAQSWIGKEMPFHQIHGHEGVWWWPTQSFHDDVPDEVKSRSGVDRWLRRSWVHIGDKKLLSIDPKLDRNWQKHGWIPMVLHQAGR